MDENHFEEQRLNHLNNLLIANYEHYIMEEVLLDEKQRLVDSGCLVFEGGNVLERV